MKRRLRLDRARLQVAADLKGKAHLARQLGVHITTLQGLLDDSWTRIERDTIEQLCDHFNCNLGDIFSLDVHDFWRPFINAQSFYMLRGVAFKSPQKHISFLDEDARHSLIQFSQKHLPGVKGHFVHSRSIRTPKQIIEFAKENNCIVVGAHPSNRAFEVLTCKQFGAVPFDNSSANKSLVPFRFVKNAHDAVSAIVDQPRRAFDLGIYSALHEGLLVKADRVSEHQYLDAEMTGAIDAALVIVVNRPFGTAKDVKLIILAGISGVGTLAAATAIQADYDKLEPTSSGVATIGVLEVRYDKKAGQEYRTLRGYEWKYLKKGVPSGAA